jgi:2,4-dienoyl-CoA reductase-like NADH-dependent reductase (Old Yellow Enzyme family)
VNLDSATEDAIALVRGLLDQGIDAIHVSGAHAAEAANLSVARALKQAFRIPVLCSGGFHTAAAVRGALREGACDVVGLARPRPVAAPVLRVPPRVGPPEPPPRRPSRPRRALSLALASGGTFLS